MKKIIFSVIISLFLLTLATSSPALAQSSNANVCINLFHLSYDLHMGSRDVTSQENVSALQNLLISKGYLAITAPTGYFGSLTKAALASYQANLGVYPSVGYFGPVTRAKLKLVLCSGINPNQNMSISALSPTGGAVGTQVTIFGQGFAATGNTVNFGDGIIPNVSSNVANPLATVSSLTFNVPQYLTPACRFIGTPCLDVLDRLTTPGNYSVSVTNSSGTSNSANFAVTSVSSGNGVVINSVTSPTNLNVNQIGTWTVSASSLRASVMNDTLTYSANWGDYDCLSAGAANPCAPTGVNNGSSQPSLFQQSATFTHSYNRPGTYTATFTVRNSLGDQAQTTATVNVGSTASNCPGAVSPTGMIPSCVSISLNPTSGTVGSVVTINGSGFTTGANTVYFAGAVIPANTITASGGTVSSLYFTVPSSVSACGTTPNCSAPLTQITPGTYSVLVKNSNGTSNTSYFTVTSSQSASPISLSLLSPSSGKIGAQVTIYGSGFTSTNNTIKWKGYNLTIVSSANNALTFNVPSFYGPAYTDGPTYQVVAGTYDIAVQNANGISNALNFTVVTQ